MFFDLQYTPTKTHTHAYVLIRYTRNLYFSEFCKADGMQPAGQGRASQLYTIGFGSVLRKLFSGMFEKRYVEKEVIQKERKNHRSESETCLLQFWKGFDREGKETGLGLACALASSGWRDKYECF